MCAIAGMISREPPALAVLDTMLNAMAHRGPDGAGAWRGEVSSGGVIWLGHRRLAIIDLSDAASQPMWDTSGRYALVFNGEIYNYLELRQTLRARGIRFATQSDSEVILEAYKTWGSACLDHLNGMFALAIWDCQAQTLFAARDRYGEKPFLFVAKDGLFAFASEFKALLCLPEASVNHDPVAALRFAVAQTHDGERQTLFSDIRQLAPGEMLFIDAKQNFCPSFRKWYCLKPDRSPPSSKPDEEFAALLRDSIKLRLRSDVPLGSCLSGGLNSSAIVCLAREQLPRDAPYHTFTGVFPGTYADEGRYADIVVNATNAISHRVEPSAERFVAEAAQFVWMNELPVGSASQFAQWCVFAAAKQSGITVLLDGQGADEILAGYEQYFAAYVETLRLAGQDERLARELPQIRARYPLALATQTQALRDRLPFGLRHFIANTAGAGSSFLFGVRRETAELLRAETASNASEGMTPLGSALFQDSFGRFLTTLLRYGDRNSMAHSREVRLPFCDHRIAEFVLGLSAEHLMGEAQTKRLLRESMKAVLPEPIRARWNKQGFRPPQDLWLANRRFRELMHDTLSVQRVREDPHYERGAWERMLKRAEAGRSGLGWTLWQPFILELWRQHFVDRIALERSALKHAA